MNSLRSLPLCPFAVNERPADSLLHLHLAPIAELVGPAIGGAFDAEGHFLSSLLTEIHGDSFPAFAIVADGLLLHNLAVHQDVKFPVTLIMRSHGDTELVRLAGFQVDGSFQGTGLVSSERMHE